MKIIVIDKLTDKNGVEWFACGAQLAMSSYYKKTALGCVIRTASEEMYTPVKEMLISASKSSKEVKGKLLFAKNITTVKEFVHKEQPLYALYDKGTLVGLCTKFAFVPEVEKTSSVVAEPEASYVNKTTKETKMENNKSAVDIFVESMEEKVTPRTVDVVKYNGKFYIHYKNNGAGYAQLIAEDGKKFSGTPSPAKLEVVKSISCVEFNNSFYFKCKKGVFSAVTGDAVVHPKILEMFK